MSTMSDSIPHSPATAVTVCPDCSLILQQVVPLPHQVAVCPRCSQPLHRYKHNAIQKALVLSLTGLLLFLPANMLPLLTFSVLGTDTRSSILQACLGMFDQGQYVLGITVALTTLVFPLLILSGLLLITLGLTRQWQAAWMPGFFRTYHHLTDWAMTDVFLVGVLVTIVKMSHTATITLDPGFFCFIGLVLTTITAQTVIDRELFWSLMERNEATLEPVETAATARPPESGEADDFLLCHCCHKLLPAGYISTSGRHHCPRCGHALHSRKKNSIARTWSLILTACILTVPANLLPIMEVERFGVPAPSTIMDGILFFFKEGSYGIGLIILIASILVPLFKIIGLAIILLSIHFHWHSWLRHKAIMFRYIEFIGRWSMLDIFVITLLCSLAQFGFLSSINAAPATFYFIGVVLSTMFAALSFDPRLLWDAAAVAPSPQDTHGKTNHS
jgi:paraquat-inducible protein A